jgi:hypothetical protein
MARQAGLFDLEERLRELSAKQRNTEDEKRALRYQPARDRDS